MNPKTADLIWQDDGSPRSARFDDPYFSASGGLEETRHVFLTGNSLPERFTKRFHIAELGFGTGLNLLAAWQAWLASGQKTPLRFTSFEAYPFTHDDMQKAHKAWPELAAFSAAFLAHWPCTSLRLSTLHFDLIVGDAGRTLPQWQSKAEAWFLDGFSPSKNPEMWSDELMLAVGQHTTRQGSFATYSSAGHVRRALKLAGFDVQRAKGYGRKRHMSLGKMRG